MTRQLHLNAFLTGVGHHEAAWRHRAHRRTKPDRRRALPASGPTGRTRQAGFGVLCRRVGCRAAGDAQHAGDLRADHAAHRDGDGHRAHRPDRHRDHRLHRALHPGPQLRLPGSHQRRPGRVEHRHLGGEDEAANFGVDGIPDHAGRYRRATEFVDVATALWDSWEDDALVLDEASGAPSPIRIEVHRIDHDGEHFKVRGPLNTPRSVQGRPLLVQAGSSESGKDFAARYAEAIFTAQRSVADGKAFYRDVKARAVRSRPQRRRGEDPARHRAVHRAHRGSRSRTGTAVHRPDLARVLVAPAVADARSGPDRACARRTVARVATHRADPGQQEPLPTGEGSRQQRVADACGS